jgi:hypothetical protein
LKKEKNGVSLALTAKILGHFPAMKEFSYKSMFKDLETLIKVRLKSFVEQKIQ